MDITLVVVLVILILALSACVPAGPTPHAPVIPPQLGSWLGGLLTFLLTIALITAIVVAAVVAYTWFAHRAEAVHTPTQQRAPSASPLEIAQRRYAAGELSRDAYLQMVADLTGRREEG